MKKKPTAFQKWFNTFVEEKGLDLEHEFTYNHNGTTHFMSVGFIKELILNAPANEQKQIKDKIVYIDFKNGDVMHFFEFLGSAYIKMNY